MNKRQIVVAWVSGLTALVLVVVGLASMRAPITIWGIGAQGRLGTDIEIRHWAFCVYLHRPDTVAGTWPGVAKRVNLFPGIAYSTERTWNLASPAGGTCLVVTTRVSLWLPVLLYAAYPFMLLVVRPLRSARRHGQLQCYKCGYSLVGNESGVCPECGTADKGWVVPAPQRVFIALICTAIVAWVLEYVIYLGSLEHRIALWMVRNFSADIGAWWIVSCLRTVVCGFVTIGTYVFLSPERFEDRDR